VAKFALDAYVKTMTVKATLPVDVWTPHVAAVLAAAHDPELGAQRSVCLADVLAFINAVGRKYTCSDDLQGQVAAMREARASGLTQREIALHFGISRGNVSKIVNNRSYLDV